MNDSLALARQLLEIIPPVMQTLASELRRTGQVISPSHFGVMAMLHLQTCNLSELAEHQWVSLPTMSITISRLEESGLVTRTRDENDRRVVMIELTAAGIHKLDQIRDIAETRISVVLSDLSSADKKSLANGLGILGKVFELNKTLDSATDEEDGALRENPLT